MAEGAAYIV